MPRCVGNGKVTLKGKKIKCPQCLGARLVPKGEGLGAGDPPHSSTVADGSSRSRGRPFTEQQLREREFMRLAGKRPRRTTEQIVAAESVHVRVWQQRQRERAARVPPAP